MTDPNDSPSRHRHAGRPVAVPCRPRAITGVLLALFGVLAVAGCASQSKMRHPPKTSEYFPQSKYGKASPRVVSYGAPVPKGGGRYHVGKPYKVAGKWYRPRENPKYRAVGIASWYGSAFHGRKTANGEIYDMSALTAAHPTLPLPSYVRVTNLHNNRSVIVRVNDRGPFAHGRIIDLSQRAAELLDYKKRGTAKVRVEYVGKARMDGQDHEYLMASLRINGRPVNGGPTTPGHDSRTQPVMVADATPRRDAGKRRKFPIGFSLAKPVPRSAPTVVASASPADTLVPSTSRGGAATSDDGSPAPRVRPLPSTGMPLDIRPQSLSATMQGRVTESGSTRASATLDEAAWGNLAESPEFTGSISAKTGHKAAAIPASRSYRAARRVATAHLMIDRMLNAARGGQDGRAARGPGAPRLAGRVLQAAVFADAANAQRARLALADLGDIAVSSFTRDGMRYHAVRVRLGAGISASMAQERARARGFVGAYVLR